MPLFPSLYVSSFEKQKKDLKKYIGRSELVFTNLHLREEFDLFPDYPERVKAMIHWLHEQGFSLIAAINRDTLEFFQQDSLTSLIEHLAIDQWRLDSPFSADELPPVGFHQNASSLLTSVFSFSKNETYASFNHYPRPETGVSLDYVTRRTRALKEEGLKVLAFIPGDDALRLPLKEGLPTVETHRYGLPYIAYLELIIKAGVDGAIVGDPGLSEEQFELIRHFDKTGQILLPVSLEKAHHNLYHRPLVLRTDSPEGLFRIMEPWEKNPHGAPIEPTRPQPRLCGSITIDNLHYQCYSGEVQILKEDFPADHRVNLIGRLSHRYRPLLQMMEPGMTIQLIPERQI